MTVKVNKKVNFESYIKENWGSPFVVGFITLLSSAAIYLKTGLASLADTLATYAFYALVIGVILQLFCYLRYQADQTEAV